MHFEIKTVRWICDFCNKTEDIVTTSEHERPEGWGTKAIGGFGMTDYTKTFECCEVCDKKVVRQDDTRYWLEDPPPPEEPCSQPENISNAPSADTSTPSPTTPPHGTAVSARQSSGSRGRRGGKKST